MTGREAEKWDGSKEDADRITSWCHANGGEARFDDAVFTNPQVPNIGFPRIAVRTRDGWAYCSPGQWVVMGEWFPFYRLTHAFREFTVESR